MECGRVGDRSRSPIEVDFCPSGDHLHHPHLHWAHVTCFKLIALVRERIHCEIVVFALPRRLNQDSIALYFLYENGIYWFNSVFKNESLGVIQCDNTFAKVVCIFGLNAWTAPDRDVTG
jgi:hypothetical protein